MKEQKKARKGKWYLKRREEKRREEKRMNELSAIVCMYQLSWSGELEMRCL